jgi:hypothetical protein
MVFRELSLSLYLTIDSYIFCLGSQAAKNYACTGLGAVIMDARRSWVLKMAPYSNV